MKKINFIYGIHCHQPVGNFDRIFKQAYEHCYRPFLETLYKHPKIKCTIHLSGVLYDWLVENARDYLDLLKEMVERNQVELLGGGYFEPILPIIPERDAVGQINMLSEFIRDNFGYKVRGLWLAERVWEPHLPRIIRQCNLEYTFLDNFHFQYAGLDSEEILSYYSTEEQGVRIDIFANSHTLRYLVPFRSSGRTLDYLKKYSSEEGNRLITLVDDGEKFGLWPGTHELVYKKGWLQDFFKRIEDNFAWLNIITPSEYRNLNPAHKLCYIPAAAYREMMSWSVPADADAKLSLKRKGFFRNFFYKYPEANNLHKKMFYVSEKVKAAGVEAKKELYKGQCSCAYWHGVFGGLYLVHLRRALYNHLIKAESMADELKTKRPTCEVVDFDLDGEEEVILKNNFLSFYIAPKKGGGIFEIDYKPKNINLCNVLKRTKEFYHRKIIRPPRINYKKVFEGLASIHDLLRSKQKGLKKFLYYDQYQKLCFLEHILTSTKLDDFIKGRLGQGFFNQHYSCEIIGAYSVKLTTKSSLLPTLELSKGYILDEQKGNLGIDYNLKNIGDEEIKTLDFGIELNLSLSFDNGTQMHLHKQNDLLISGVDNNIDITGLEKLKITDSTQGIRVIIEAKKDFSLWSFPSYTVSSSEDGFEKNYQHTSIMLRWQIKLAPRAVFNLPISFGISAI